MPSSFQEVPMTVGNWRTYAAELLGTFMLVFIGTTAIVAAGRANAPVLLAAAFAFGLALLAGLYAFAEVSGGHYNPAVSLALFLDRRLPLGDLVGYWIAQFIGGILAAIVLLVATSQADVASTATVPSSNGTAFLIELVMTTLFVLVILQASRSERFGTSALIAIPLTLLAVHLAAIPFSGSSVNPARTFGPDLIGNRWTGLWIYLIAPPLGAVLAWVIHAGVVRGAVAPTAPAVAEVLEEPAADERARRRRAR
ncbi:MAG: MIP/aquaporin family protein [Gaiellaceae bacterium]